MNSRSDAEARREDGDRYRLKCDHPRQGARKGSAILMRALEGIRAFFDETSRDRNGARMAGTVQSPRSKVQSRAAVGTRVESTFGRDETGGVGRDNPRQDRETRMSSRSDAEARRGDGDGCRLMCENVRKVGSQVSGIGPPPPINLS
jgi:hypothetical protein